jgi:hypothetical protein
MINFRFYGIILVNVDKILIINERGGCFDFRSRDLAEKVG